MAKPVADLKNDYLAAEEKILQFGGDDEDSFAAILDFLVSSIEEASRLANERWGLTLSQRFLRLNLGNIEVMALFPDAVRVIVDRDAFLRDIGDGAEMLHPENGSTLYGSVPGSAACEFEWDASDEWLEAIRRSHRVLLENAAETRTHPRTHTGHSPAAVEVVAYLSERKLRQPDYAAAPPTALPPPGHLNDSELLS